MINSRSKHKFSITSAEMLGNEDIKEVSVIRFHRMDNETRNEWKQQSKWEELHLDSLVHLSQAHQLTISSSFKLDTKNSNYSTPAI